MAPHHRKIAFIYNPNSGTGIMSAECRKVEKFCLAENLSFVLIPSRKDGRYLELEERIMKGEFTDIVIMGGDGTFNQVCSSLRHTGVNFGIIPLGSGNGLALGAGIPRNAHKALQIILKGNARPVDGILINGRFSCMLSGIGFDAQVALDFSKRGSRGIWTYIKVVAGHFFSVGTHDFRILVKGMEIRTKAYFISIANSNQFGNSFTIAPKAKLDDGLVDVVIVNKMNKLELVLSILHQMRFGDVQEGIFGKRNIFYFQTDELDVINPERAPLHIDGDPGETDDHLSIRVQRAAFRLLQP